MEEHLIKCFVILQNAKNYPWASGGASILSEFGTLHMEFSYLTEITGDPKYREKVLKIREAIMAAERPKKLYPNYFNPKNGKWGQQHTSGKREFQNANMENLILLRDHSGSTA